MDKTLFIVKPQSEYLIPIVVKWVSEEKLEVELWREGRLPASVAEEIYQDHQAHRWFPPLISYMSSGRVYVFLAKGQDALVRVKEVKNRVRADFRWGKFRSVMHCPNDIAELKWNIEALERFFVARLEID